MYWCRKGTELENALCNREVGDEVNHHVDDDNLIVLDDSDIDEINEAISVLGVDTSIKRLLHLS